MQRPMNSGWGERTTAQEVARGSDLSGKTVLVTGGHSGIGLESTRVLAAAGARIIVGARDMAKARAALAGTFTLFTGIVGVLLVRVISALVRVTDSRAQGLAAGTAGHGLTTAHMLSISRPLKYPSTGLGRFPQMA
ncbi:SDR family NAD(P)-dependent oxidoreductase [Burkholderia gladioli]|uniref:SDR family NAD(P)-dependent oxidoreductase n=1 Tax=Burkholderia gladioli TaxID=28095 RepID=UPI001641225E|nr:SDR family NAD(P)-dependent oxidoreductase [Burkholderia gladioli]